MLLRNIKAINLIQMNLSRFLVSFCSSAGYDLFTNSRDADGCRDTVSVMFKKHGGDAMNARRGAPNDSYSFHVECTRTATADAVVVGP
jgi:hypothetical protein